MACETLQFYTYICEVILKVQHMRENQSYFL